MLRTFPVSDWEREVIEWNEVRGQFCGYDEYLQEQLVLEELRELKEAIEQEDKEGTLKEACDLFVVASYYAYQNNWSMDLQSITCGLPLMRHVDYALNGYQYWGYIHSDLMSHVLSIIYSLPDVVRAAMEAIISSNWSKFEKAPSKPTRSSAEQLDNNAGTMQRNSNGRYVDVKWKIVDSSKGKVVVYTDSNNKIMKPPTYKAPDLGDLI